MINLVAIENPERHVRKASHRGSKATIEITRRDHSIIACLRHIDIFLFFAHIPFVVNHIINATPPERLQQSLV